MDEKIIVLTEVQDALFKLMEEICNKEEKAVDNEEFLKADAYHHELAGVFKSQEIVKDLLKKYREERLSNKA